MMLRLQGVRASYADVDVLRGVDLDLEAGQAVALIGPNGAGKTTTLRVASGLLAAKAGVVEFAGAPQQSAERMAAAGLCHIPEGRGVFKGLAVRQNLRLFAPAADDGTFLDRAMAAFPKLGERLEQRAGTLSGGEQQMLALTRAFAEGVRCLLIDEASLGLAPIIVDEIYVAIASLRSSGVSLLLVEQYIDRALALADVIYVLQRGEVCLRAAAGEVSVEQITDQYLGRSA
jgi:branched-chain amino acid transport system ATP-binding protein